MMSVTVDRFVAGPHGHAGAPPEPDELKRWKLDRDPDRTYMGVLEADSPSKR
jgi:hypothetical protein